VRSRRLLCPDALRAGTGKTLLVRELVSAAGLPLLALPLGELLAGELGQSERRLRRLFDEVCLPSPLRCFYVCACVCVVKRRGAGLLPGMQAERRRPCVVFLDEFEALFGAREALGPHARKLISQLLLLLDSQRTCFPVPVCRPATRTEAGAQGRACWWWRRATRRR
jgi:SpoVK/Ycf46/Vps4 family AAA+-type ATPase